MVRLLFWGIKSKTHRLLLYLYILIFSILGTGCGTVSTLEQHVKTEYIHDTVNVYCTDTVVKERTVQDSVERLVEHFIYTDSNGVVHDKEFERLNHYMYESNDMYKSFFCAFNEKLDKLGNQLDSKKEVVVEEKKVYILWPLYIAVPFVLASGFIVYKKVRQCRGKLKLNG